MLGLTGIEVARWIGRRAHVVFITAFDSHPLEAFKQNAFDDLVKPLQASRLGDSLARLRKRIRLEQPALASEAMLATLAARLTSVESASASGTLRWPGR